eukprot:2451172-Amphidinium_carterae.1
MVDFIPISEFYRCAGFDTFQARPKVVGPLPFWVSDCEDNTRWDHVRPRSQDWEERMHERVTHVLEDTGKFLVEPPDTLLYRRGMRCNYQSQ